MIYSMLLSLNIYYFTRRPRFEYFFPRLIFMFKFPLQKLFENFRCKN
jgi:hypothetical protein